MWRERGCRGEVKKGQQKKLNGQTVNDNDEKNGLRTVKRLARQNAETVSQLNIAQWAYFLINLYVQNSYKWGEYNELLQMLSYQNFG